MGKRGVVLLISLVVMVIIMVLTGVYFSSLLTENKSAEIEKAYLQALSLAEGGANHLFVELRERIQGDHELDQYGNPIPLKPLGLKGRIKDIISVFDFTQYNTVEKSLFLLRDYAYAYNDSARFDNNGELFVVPLDLETPTLKGKYTISNPNDLNDNSNPVITITSTKAPEDKSSGGMLNYIFYYNYSIKVRGKVLNSLGRIIVSKTVRLFGSFKITIYRPTFARFALFSSHHSMPSGDTVWFTNNTNFTGPVHTNTRFSFANNPGALFTEEVSQHETKARFYNNGNPVLRDADSNPPRDVPTFQGGFTRGAPLINLPSSVTQQDLKNQATGGQNDGSWSSGTYLPYDIPSGRTKTECETNADGLKCPLAGGIYIKGNSSNLTMGVVDDASNNPVYIIKQGTNTKKITIDYGNNETIVTNISGSGGTPPSTYSGIPDGADNEGIIIYDNGSISNFSGKVQSDTRVTVSSNSDIVISPNPDITVDNKLSYDNTISTDKHIRYQSYNAGPPPNAEGYTNLLGILTWNGNVRIGNSAPNDIDIHGVIMATKSNGIFTVDNYNTGSPRGTATLFGGAITDFYGPFNLFSGANLLSGYGRNFVYDPRMLQGASPPYFPYLPGLDSSDTGLSDKPIWQDKGV